jgi:hypothetical protein
MTEKGMKFVCLPEPRMSQTYDRGQRRQRDRERRRVAEVRISDFWVGVLQKILSSRWWERGSLGASQ